MASIASRVARGAKWLDKNAPGWERRVHVTKLNMASGCRCVLGFVFADKVADGYVSGFEYGMYHPSAPSMDAMRLGFDVDLDINDSGQSREYRDLGNAWKALIRERRKAGTRSGAS